MLIEIPEELILQINRHGEAAYPHECCGMLLGVREDESLKVRRVLPIDNSQEENRRRRFLITPAQYLEAERVAVAQGCELLGFYHSHPDHPAVPSAFDTAHALPWFTYVIVSINGGRAENLSAWVLSADRERFDEQTIAERTTITQSNMEKRWQ